MTSTKGFRVKAAVCLDMFGIVGCAVDKGSAKGFDEELNSRPRLPSWGKEVVD